MRTAGHWTGPTLRPKAPERPSGASVFRFPDGREETTRMAVTRCGKGAPPRPGGFLPGDRGSFSERDIQDRYPAYTVAMAAKGTSDC